MVQFKAVSRPRDGAQTGALLGNLGEGPGGGEGAGCWNVWISATVTRMVGSLRAHSGSAVFCI